jgi:hypothetical protein
VTRKARADDRELTFQNQCADVFQSSTQDQRRIIAMHWVSGNFEEYHDFAFSQKLLPAAVITASLLDVEHPVIVNAGRLIPRTLVGAFVLILQAEIRRGEVVPTPVYNSEVVHRLAEVDA